MFAQAKVIDEKKPTGTQTLNHSLNVIFGSETFTNLPWTSIVESTNANIVPHEETNIGFPNPASLIKCLFETTVIVENVRYPMVYSKAGSLLCAEYFDSNEESLFFSGGGVVGVVEFFIESSSSSSSRGC
jgi:hypothetical protein